MSAYNQVPRLTTTNPLKMHHNHNHHRHLGHQLGGRQNSGPPLVEAVDEQESSQSFVGGSSGQRKWRVLASICLLLPALAAIIGIVAWTISIEVANSNTSPVANQAAASAMAQVRRAERVQRQQQFRRDEALALAAIIGARRGQQQPPRSAARTQMANNSSEQPMSAPLIQQHDQAAARPQTSHLNDTNDKSNKNDSDGEDEKQRRSRQQPASAPLRPTRTSQRQAAPTMIQSVASSSSSAAPAARQQAATLLVGAARGGESVPPVVTNTDQLETLTSSSQETQSLAEPAKEQEGQEDKAKSTRKRDEGRARDEQKRNSDGVQEREDKMGDQSSEARETPAPEQAADEEANRWSSTGSGNAATKPDEQDQGFEQTPIEQESLSGIDEKDDQQQQQVASGGERDREKDRSRWASMANGASKRPMKQVIETNKKLASAKQIYQENNQNKRRGHRFGGTKSSNSRAKSNSEYKLLTVNEPETMTNERDEQEQILSSTPQPQTTTTTTAATETTASVRDCGESGDKQRAATSEMRPDESAQTLPASNQDEVSFAIASAISKSLSDSQAAAGSGETESGTIGGDSEAPARAIAEMLSDAIASSAKPRQESSSADDETEPNAREATESASDEGQSSDDSVQRAAKRRRTTGEHLAEVIDHIVEKRNHQRLARFGERTVASDGGSSSNRHQFDHQEGPQIVVVAPVGPNGALLKARSLTKEPVKSEGKSNSTAVTKKLSEPVKKKAQQQQPKATRIGGRLLGVDSSDAPSKSETMKYSERVEVIEDDDSSALLLPSPAPDATVESRSLSPDQIETGKLVVSDGGSTENEDDDIELEERKSSERNQMANQQADLLALNQDQLSSIHVSSNSGEARLRSPRHDSRQMFERYAPMPQQQQQQVAPMRYQQEQPQQSRQQKLYTAEQVIMEHVLKSKVRSRNEHQQRSEAAQKQQQGEPMKKQRAVPASGKGAPQEASSTPATDARTTSTTTSQTPVAATIASGGDQREANNQAEQASRPQQQHRARQQLDQTMMMMATSEQSASETRPNNGERHYQPQAAEYASMQPVQVPALFIQQSGQMPHRPRQFLPSNLQAEPYQTMESQQQQVQIVRPPGGAYESAQDQQNAGESQHDHQTANENQQQQQQQALPVFADQEIQVPAHMAESVIRDLQQAPSTVQGMLNGQPALFQAQPTMMAQVPHQQPHHHQNHHLGQQHQMMMMMMQQQQHHHHHQQRPHHIHQAESYQRPTFAAAEQSQQQPQMSYLRQALNYSPLALMSRLTSARRHPNEQQIHQDRPQPNDRQVLASRASGKDESKKQQALEQPQESSLLDTAVKALAPKGLMQPVAQMALKNLFNSLGQQAAAQQAQADAQELRHRSNQQRSSQQAASPQLGPEGAAVQEPMAAGSSPAAVLSELPQGGGGRSMRSLPIGAQAPPSQQLMQPIGMAGASGASNGDQDVQESYGQMPAYHMAPSPHYQGAGGGGHGESYQGDHDKKTKGITFHFGGGPIGGGTQLITSPMGIFKHLMIPLLPNPRVNLNGKVVFGVVLEKSTAFGPPPKKKHFLWG